MNEKNDKAVERVALRELFLQLQKVMIAQLTATRTTLPHPGNKGDATETHWTDMLTTHLPQRYKVRKARVIDHTGALSDAIDVVIFDAQYCPLILEDGDACYVPAESVYAVCEVKQELTKAHVEYAGAKAASVRRLLRTSAPIVHAGGTYAPKQPLPILAGLLTLTSDWTPPLGKSFDAALGGLAAEEELQFGCVLEHGAWECTHDDEGGPRTIVSGAETALISFFLTLLASLQRMGTVPAIDLAEYAKSL
jgi:hypothetical protein